MRCIIERLLLLRKFCRVSRRYEFCCLPVCRVGSSPLLNICLIAYWVFIRSLLRFAFSVKVKWNFLLLTAPFTFSDWRRRRCFELTIRLILQIYKIKCLYYSCKSDEQIHIHLKINTATLPNNLHIAGCTAQLKYRNLNTASYIAQVEQRKLHDASCIA